MDRIDFRPNTGDWFMSFRSIPPNSLIPDECFAIALKETIGQAFEYRTLEINSERGNIYDRQGYLLAGNSVSYTVSLKLQASNSHGEFIANYLAPILNMDHDVIKKSAEIKFDEKKAVEMPLTNFATKEQIEKIDQVKSFLSQREVSKIESKSKIWKIWTPLSIIQISTAIILIKIWHPMSLDSFLF